MSVVIGYVHGDDVSHVFMKGFVDLVMYDARHDKAVSGWIEEKSGPWLSRSRNLVVRRFMDTEAEWLWMVDTDLYFAPDTLSRLLRHATVRHARVIGGLYYGLADKPFPMIYQTHPETGEAALQERWEPGEVVDASLGTGAGCLLIHREVLDAVATRQHNIGNDAYPWFAESTYMGDPVGEDLTFCMRARSAGFWTWVDTSVDVRHSKSILWGTDQYRAAMGW